MVNHLNAQVISLKKRRITFNKFLTRIFPGCKFACLKQNIKKSHNICCTWEKKYDPFFG